MRPPEALWDRDETDPLFVPDRELEKWVRSNIIDAGGTLFNPDHGHLRLATVGFLWTNVECRILNQQIAGMAQRGQPTGMPWSAKRAEAQICEWFGHVPDFLITLDGPYFAMSEEATCLAVIEHELYHCAQARDRDGFPKYHQKTSMPIWGLRGHDVEEFVGVVRRYGADAAGVREMVEAGNREPEIAAAKIAKVCGNCLKAA